MLDQNHGGSDINTIESTKIDTVTTSYGLQQLVTRLTHLLANSSSCIGLTFADQASLIVDCGIHSPLHPNCHHQIVYCKLDLKIVYLPPYQRQVWDFKRANIDSVRKAIKIIHCHFMLLIKNVHEQVSTVNTTLMNIFSNYIPSKYITVGDKDCSWMTGTSKNKINLKKSLSRSKNFIRLQNLAIEVSELISIRKEEYYNNLSKKLNDPNTSAKTYWSILKSFCKGNRVLLIPLLLVNNPFNDFFASQCTLISSIIPSRKIFKTNKRLFALNIKKDDILKIFRKLNVNKACGHHDIPIRMLKICDSVNYTIKYHFKKLLIFPETWEMSQIIPAHKKNDKCSVNNYCPVSLLTICGKVFERIIFNSAFYFLKIIHHLKLEELS